MRTFTLILEDFFCRKYRATFIQDKPNHYPKLDRLERWTIVPTSINVNEHGFQVSESHGVGYTWSLYRESCHGKLNTGIKLAIQEARDQIRKGSAA